VEKTGKTGALGSKEWGRRQERQEHLGSKEWGRRQERQEL
jgi:hypothetical protein